MTAALVSGSGTAAAVAAYLPANYAVTLAAEGNGWVLALVEGNDDAGWTMTGYVSPRLASGLYAAFPVDGDAGYAAVSAARRIGARDGVLA